MARIDKAAAQELLERAGRIAPDARPGWGRMTPAQMLGHLAAVLRYASGEGPERPFSGAAASRDVIGPRIIEGRIPIPENVELPGRDKNSPPLPDGTVSIDAMNGATGV